LGWAIVGGALLPLWGFDRTASVAAQSENAAGPASSPGGETIRDYTLTAQMFETQLEGTRVRLRSYNGQIPGPVLMARPGDTLRIRIENKLPQYDSTGWNGDRNVPHQLHTTNLHLHGLEIMPHLFEPVGTSEATADMIAISPGAAKLYTFKIPVDQPPGLFWYHPHHHGSTAVQAVSGMAGGLIIHGDIDEVPAIKAAKDILIVVQDIGLFPSETEEGLWTYEPKQNAIWNTLDSKVTLNGKDAPQPKGGFTTGDYKLRYFLINGNPFYKEIHNCKSPTSPIGAQLQVPRFTLQPGEVVRFRMLNANSDNVMPVVVEDHELHVIGLDGVNLYPTPRIIPVKPIDGTSDGPQLLLAPANRVEFMLKANTRTGVYKIVQLEQRAQFLFSSRRVLAEIEVLGEPVNMALPTELPKPTRHYPLIQPAEVKRRRELVLSMGVPAVQNPIVGLDFMINNQLYDEEAIVMTVDRDSVEEWHLSVPDATHGGSEGHPFHLHVNSFEVISIDGKMLPAGTIQDTIWIPQNSKVVIRIRFREWTGKAVYHCHILPHEDTGMMQNFLIRDPESDS
jgi:suppressor of ftsI